ncbi:hypothetical protein [Ruminococcus albus]|uniref:Uncharacterized protein n=1 Tax=Ruminococcus albus TaxID=1264 RepID=A0A1H7EYU6_RUMAL|nr:hypothetical protein [Ruminococcus albus]SEK18774.1 hypothetical protein SAMN05216469_1014 [Ruminococcus albus]
MNILIFIALIAAVIFAVLTILVIKKHKKIYAAVLCVFGVLFCVGAIWFFMPFKMLDVPSEQIIAVRLFSGRTGEGINITDKEDIEKIAEAFDGVVLRRKEASWRSGYYIHISFELENGITKDYIVNDSDNVTRGMIIYDVTSGSVDISTLEEYIQ